MLRALLILQVILPPQPDPADPYRLPPTQGPQLGSIEVHGDSVLFFTTPEFPRGPTTSTVYAFSRADRTWARVGVETDLSKADRFGRSRVRDGYWWGDEGARLLVDEYFRPPPGEEGIVRLNHLLLYPDTDTIRFAVPAPTDGGPRPTKSVNSFAVLDDTLWMGLASYGDPNERSGTRGGLVAFALRERQVAAYWLPELGRSSVHEIEKINGRLWIATDNGVGIRRPDGSWEWLRVDGRGVTSSTVFALEPMGDTVWFVTSTGPRGFADGVWFGGRWVPAMSGDSVVMELTDDPPSWSEDDAILRLAWILRLDRWGAGFVDAMSHLPRETLDAWRGGTRSLESIVLEPSLYPYLVESYLLRPGNNSLAARAVTRYAPEDEVLARHLLLRATASSLPAAREAAYRLLRDRYPDLVIEDAREVLSRDSAPRLDRILAVQALGPLGDVSDLPTIFRLAPRGSGGTIDGAYFSSIAQIIARSNPLAVVSALRQQPVADRVITLSGLPSPQHWRGWSTARSDFPWRTVRVPRPTLVAECMVARDALTDASATVDELDDMARMLDALGIPDGIPFIKERPSWRPEGIVDRLSEESELRPSTRLIDRLSEESRFLRDLPSQASTPGFDALKWTRSWWAQFGRHRPPTDCWMLPAVGVP